MKESKFFEEVLAEGRVEGQRNAILDALDVRFGSEVKTEFTPLLATITNYEQLAQLHRLAVKCRRVNEFRKQLS